MKLERMTPEQEEAMLAHRAYWLKVGLSTETAEREMSIPTLFDLDAIETQERGVAA